MGADLFAISRRDLRRLRDLQLQYVRQLQAVISESQPGECVGLFCTQLGSRRVRETGTLATTDGLLAETFELELLAQSLDELSVGEQRLSPSELDGTLPAQMPELAHLSWGFGVDGSEAWFEVQGVVQYASTSRSRARAGSADGRPRAGHSSGVTVDLEDARR